MADEQKATLTVDGKDYDPETISDNAKNLIRNVQFADQELTRLRMQVAAIQTARQAYVNSLKAELETDTQAEAGAPEAQ